MKYLILFLCFLLACSTEQNHSIIPSREGLPDQESWGVNIILTDEGITRAKVQSGHLEKYNEKEVNYIGKRILSDLPNDLHEELLNKDAGQSLDIREIGENLNLILICDRKDDVGLQVSREAIEDNIYSQKIGMMSRRYLRDLRRDAVIEYR